MAKETTAIEQKISTPMTGSGLAPRSIDEAWQMAKTLAASSLVPSSYQGKPSDCMIAIDIAARTRSNWLAVMQHLYVVHGRPAFDAQFSIGLVNNSGAFSPIQYEVDGDDVSEKGYRVRAFSTRAGTDTILYGPWIDWNLVKGEGWDKKEGSKWKTMPDQMFHYRAASWWIKRHAPDLVLGMPTSEELDDMPEPKQVESKVVSGVERVKELLETPEKAPETPQEGQTPPDPTDDNPDEQKSPVEAGDTLPSKDADCEVKSHCLKCGCQSGEDAKDMRGKPCPSCGSKLGWKSV